MRTCFVVVGFLLSACGDDGGGGAPIDAAASVDGPGEDICLVPDSFGDQGAKTGTAMSGIPTSLSVTIDAGPPRDSFFLRLDANRGAFAGGQPMPGTYPLTGAEVAYSQCGVCANVIADIVTGQGPSKFYFASSGSITLTAVSPPTGSLTDVTFTEVTSAGAPVASGCSTRIASMTFGP